MEQVESVLQYAAENVLNSEWQIDPGPVKDVTFPDWFYLHLFKADVVFCHLFLSCGIWE